MKSHLVKSVRFPCVLGLMVWVSVTATSGQTPAGLGLQTYAGLTITGAVNAVYSIQCITNLTQTNSWLELTNLTLPSSPYLWVDTTAPVAGRRFYRAVWGTNQLSILIPAGSFSMGDAFSDGDTDNLPNHVVSISAFYMGKNEVTKAQWDEVYHWAITNGYQFDFGASGKVADHPVKQVTWYDAVKWCNARSEKEGLSPAYYTSAGLTVVYRSGQTNVQSDWVKWSSGYRLPTEAEWEKAARGGSFGRRFPWGDTIAQNQANYYSSASYTYDISTTRGYHPAYNDGVSPYTSPAGSFVPNGYGLFDMAGNVWKWCWDWYGSSYYSSSPGTDPRGPVSGLYRVQRGGGWENDGGARYCRLAARGANSPSSKDNRLGFRCVLPAQP